MFIAKKESLQLAQAKKDYICCCKFYSQEDKHTAQQ